MIAVTTLVWFFVTILMMGFFAGVEMAFYSANRFGIELKKKQGKQSAILLSRFIEKPQLFLSTTLIGFTLFLVCFVLLFSVVTTPLWNWIGLRNDLARLLLDIILDGGDRIDGTRGGVLHAGDVRADLLGGLCGLAGKSLHLPAR